MFDMVEVAGLSDEALISAVTAAVREESVAAAWRLALVGEVTARQCVDEDDEVAHQVIDGWAWAQAQLGAACNLGPHAASKQMRIAAALRDRLPRTAALFGTGAVSMTVISAITWRTHLVVDDDALALVDTAIAAEAAEYGRLSEKALETAVDFWVEKFDPIAVLRSKTAAKDLYVQFDDQDDPHGVSSFWGRLRVTDKIVLDERLDALADTVCPEDPRTRGQLRAAALGALGVVGPALARLACACGNTDCAGSGKDPRSGAVTIYALTDRAAAPEPGLEPESVPAPEAEAAPEPTPAPELEPEPKPAPASLGTGVLLDGSIIPAALLDELAATGAKIRPLAEITDLPAECRHRPSTALTAFVRMRSQTCTFPGCHRPAHRCDLDHLTPWPAGATHPGNLHPLCRLHHLLKTFCGWAPRLKPDGSVEWTAPTGHTYTKAPGAAILFPHWNIGTTVPPPRPITPTVKRDAMMPTRDRTRAQDREYRTNAERTSNAIELARETTESDSDPPF